MRRLERARVGLWDVRAQWESGVRLMTAAQSMLEQQSANAGARGHASVRELQENLQALKSINATVRTLLEDVERALGRD